MKKALLALASMLLTLALVEAVFRLGGIDARLLRSAVFYQAADPAVHACAADPFLHYVLKAGASTQGARSDGRPTRVTIDQSGARDPAHGLRKAAGVFRVLCFGGSTMYGAGVDDDETLPAALERRLNQVAAGQPPDSPPRYEVWNFGTSAYTLGQAAHLARQKLASLDPDLIIVQLHNVGRRPFLPGCDNIDIGLPVDGGRSFFLEQFPVPEQLSEALHFRLLAASAVYRALITRTVRVPDGSPCDYCDRLSQSEGESLVQEAAARGTPVLFVGIPYDHGGWSKAVHAMVPASHFVDLDRPGREPEFYEVHPPAAVLDEYAATLVETLRDRGFLQRERRIASDRR